MALDIAAETARLQNRYAAVCREIEEIDRNAAGGLPDVSGVAMVKHQAYKKGLYDELAAIRKELAALAGGGGTSVRFIDV